MENLENKEIVLGCQLKALDNDEEGVFEGYASTFGNIDSTDDIIMNGAFVESLKKREPKVLWQHRMDQPVGKLIEAREDNKGLYVKVKLATKTDLGRNAYEYMKAGVINSLSIGFRVKECEYNTDTNIRTITKAELFEFSLVTIPANEMALVTGLKNTPANERDFEKFLRSHGYTRTEAKAIAARGIKGYQDVLREAGVDTPCDDLREADEVKELLSNLATTLQGVIQNVRPKGNQGVGE